LLNALIGEKLAIVSSKVQTTRHRIRAFLNGLNYQIVFSDTPGVIEPKYKLHEKMMHAVTTSLEDADVCLLVADLRDNFDELDQIFSSLKLRVKSILVLNKSDLVKADRIELAKQYFADKAYCSRIVVLSAQSKNQVQGLIEGIVDLLPEGEPFYGEDELTDMPTKFFTGELIREKIFELFDEEIPYQSTVMISKFEEQQALIKISAEIIVQRESQKAIILGAKGVMIKKLGMASRQAIEQFLDSKVYLELFVKVRSNWRNNDLFLKEYGYIQ
jgi:GTP-binding protein Era